MLSKNLDDQKVLIKETFLKIPMGPSISLHANQIQATPGSNKSENVFIKAEAVFSTRLLVNPTTFLLLQQAIASEISQIVTMTSAYTVRTSEIVNSVTVIP